MRKAIATALALAALALGGCGGGGGSKAGPAPTKAQFSRQAGTTCARAYAKLALAGPRFFQSGRATDRQFVERKVLPIFGDELLGKLRRLTPPKGDRETVGAILAGADNGLARLRQRPRLLRAAPGSASDPFRDFSRLARGYGLKRCAVKHLGAA